MDYSNNITLPLIKVNKGYNNIDVNTIGNILINYNQYLPILFTNSSEDLFSIPIDFSQSTVYRDFTFKSLDVTNKRLVSLRNAHRSNRVRYYFNVNYRNKTNFLDIQNSCQYPTIEYKINISFFSVNYVNSTFKTINIIENKTTTTALTTSSSRFYIIQVFTNFIVINILKILIMSIFKFKLNYRVVKILIDFSPIFF